MVQFDTKRKTLPRFDILSCIPLETSGNPPKKRMIEQLLHGCRQLVPWGVDLSVETSATLILCSIVMRNCLAYSGEEGGDDVKSAWRLYLGPHTSYNGKLQWVAKPQGGANPTKPSLSSDRGLKFVPVKPDLVVIANQQVAVNTFSLFVHTAHQASKVGST